MKLGQDTRSLVRGLLPACEKLIDSKLGEDPAFVELCEDYRRCFVALGNLLQPAAPEDPERVRECCPIASVLL